MAEETGTSVGVITLDLRIVSKLNEQLQSIAANANRSAQQSFERVGKTVQESISKPVEVASKTIEKAITVPVENAQKSVQDTLKKTQDQTDETLAQIDAVIARHKQEANARLKEKVSLPESAPRIPTATATDVFKRRQPDVEASGHAANAPPDLNSVYKPAADSAELLRRKLQNIQMQFDAERQKLAELNAGFAQVAVGSKAWDELSAKITASEQRLISFQESMNATQAKIDEPARRAAAAAERAANQEIRAQEKVAAATEKAAQRAAQAQERAAHRATAAVQRSAAAAEVSVKRGRSVSTGALRAQTSAMISAVATNSKGIAQVGLMGRALSSSLFGSLALAVPLAAAAAGFEMLRETISLASVNNNQFKNSLNEVKANLEVAFTPIYQAILPALNAMMSWLAAATRAVATFISALFGKTYAQSLAATKQMQKNAAAAEKAKSGGSSKSKGGSKSEGSLAGFDEINVIGKKDSASGGADGSSGTDGVNYDALSTKGNEAAANLANKFKQVWAGVASGFNDYVVQPIKDNLSKFDAPVAKFKALFADIGTQCQMWMKPLSDWFRTDFKSALAQGIGDASTILAGLTDSLAMVANTVWKALRPAIDWIVRDGLPLVTNIFKEVSKTAVVMFDAVKTVFDTLWHGVIDPFAQFVSKVVVDIMNTFKNLWDQYGVTTFNNIRTVINTIKDTFLNVWNTILKPIFDQLFQTLNQLWTEHLQPLVAQIGVFVAKLVDGAMEIYNGFVAPLVNWFVKTWGPPIAGAINGIIKVIGTIIGVVADVAKALFKSLGGVVDFVTGVFTGNWKKAWQGVQNIFKGIFDALYAIARVPLNAIIKLINSVISGLNQLISGLNKIHFDIPDWVPGPLKGKSFGIHLDPIHNVPYLANGGVLTQPTLAMMGEYTGAKNNPEIAAPQSLLMDTFMETLVPLLNELEEFRSDVVRLLREIIEKNPNITLDGTTLSRLLKPYLDEENKRVGGTIF
ncbi:MAG TPA: hypothetical protein VHO71_04985 [Caproiciproducens sp.]|nr:hypothetical protein [Caproiciproducens sp.]